MNSKATNEQFRSSKAKSKSILLASFRPLFAFIVLAVVNYVSYARYYQNQASLGHWDPVQLELGEKARSSDCSPTWSYHKTFATEPLFRIWRRSFLF